MAYADIMGFSHYMAFLSPLSANPSDASWQITLDASWTRCKTAWEMVNDKAGKTLPCLFFEYSIGNVWKYEKIPIWIESVTKSYAQMVQNNLWVKGFNWYVGKYIDSDALNELKTQATSYEGFGEEETSEFVAWSDNFETGNTSKWGASTGETTITTVYSHTGDYSANLTASPTTENWLSGWDKRVKMAVDHNDVDENLTDFPLYVHICHAYAGQYDEDVSFIFDEIGSNRKKIAVTTSNGQTECYVDIELWDASAECSRFWVKVPSVSNTTDTVLYLYYDNDHPDNTAYVTIQTTPLMLMIRGSETLLRFGILIL